jgi:hypothetical protein
MKNNFLGIQMSSHDMKNVKGGYVNDSTCSASCDAGTFACCNVNSCTCEKNGASTLCTSGGAGSTSCLHSGTFSSFLEP